MKTLPQAKLPCKLQLDIALVDRQSCREKDIKSLKLELTWTNRYEDDSARQHHWKEQRKLQKDVGARIFFELIKQPASG